MHSQQVRVQADAGNPLTEKAGVLPRRQAAARSTPASEKIVTQLLAGRLHIVVNGLPCRLGQFELYRAASLLLPDGSPVNRIAVRRNVVDLERYDIATAKLLSIAILNNARSRTRHST